LTGPGELAAGPFAAPDGGHSVGSPCCRVVGCFPSVQPIDGRTTAELTRQDWRSRRTRRRPTNQPRRRHFKYKLSEGLLTPPRSRTRSIPGEEPAGALALMAPQAPHERPTEPRAPENATLFPETVSRPRLMLIRSIADLAASETGLPARARTEGARPAGTALSAGFRASGHARTAVAPPDGLDVAFGL
jgi:hypothetical protein